MDKGNTAIILNSFIEGLRETGADVDLFYLKQLEINPCQGDISCWIKTPGKCFQDDDMQMLYPKLRQADVVVFGTPVYLDGMPGPMKNLVDRLLPLLEAHIETREDHCRHAARKEHKKAKAVLVSTCGLWEMGNFDPLITHLKAICKNVCWEYAGALLRPHSVALRHMLKKGLPVKDVIDAAREAGKQLIRNGKMEEVSLQTISRELSPRESFVDELNESYKRALTRAA
jgi:multimeric flavodoxin WrbA